MVLMVTVASFLSQNHGLLKADRCGACRHVSMARDMVIFLSL